MGARGGARRGSKGRGGVRDGRKKEKKWVGETIDRCDRQCSFYASAGCMLPKRDFISRHGRPRSRSYGSSGAKSLTCAVKLITLTKENSPLPKTIIPTIPTPSLSLTQEQRKRALPSPSPPEKMKIDETLQIPIIQASVFFIPPLGFQRPPRRSIQAWESPQRAKTVCKGARAGGRVNRQRRRRARPGSGTDKRTRTR